MTRRSRSKCFGKICFVNMSATWSAVSRYFRTTSPAAHFSLTNVERAGVERGRRLHRGVVAEAGGAQLRFATSQLGGHGVGCSWSAHCCFVRCIFERKLVARARARGLWFHLDVAVCGVISRLRTPYSCTVGHSDGGERNRD
jgi:hypothetical protein